MLRILLLMLALTSTTLAQENLAQKADPIESIRKKITKAEAAYTSDLAKIHSEVVKWLDTREKEARKKGDNKAVNAIKAAREGLETEGTIPKPAPVSVTKKLETARDLLDATYASLIKDALTNSLDDLANSLEKRRAEIQAQRDQTDIFKAIATITKNLVKNGSFEYPTVRNKTPIEINQNTDWESEQATYGHIVGNWSKEPYPNGEQCLQIQGGTKTYQSVRGFEVGEKYSLIFYISTYTTPTASHRWGISNITAKIAGEAVSGTVNANGSPRGYTTQGKDHPWTPVVLVFEAKDETMDLLFEVNGPGYVLLDNVRITRIVD